MNQTMVSSIRIQVLYAAEKCIKKLEFLNLKISQFNQAESDYDMELYLAHKCRLKRVLR